MGPELLEWPGPKGSSPLPCQLQLSLTRTLIIERGKEKQKYIISAKSIHVDLKNMIFILPTPSSKRPSPTTAL